MMFSARPPPGCRPPCSPSSSGSSVASTRVLAERRRADTSDALGFPEFKTALGGWIFCRVRRSPIHRAPLACVRRGLRVLAATCLQAADRDTLRMVKESVCLLGDGSEFSTQLFGRTDTSLGNVFREYNGLRTRLFEHNQSFRPLCNFADSDCNAHKEAVHGLVLQSLHGSIERLKEESGKQGGTGFAPSAFRVKWGHTVCLSRRYDFDLMRRLIARRQASGAQAAGAQAGAADGDLTLVGFCAVASRFKFKPGDTNSIEHLISTAVRASGLNAQGQDAFDGFSMARFSGQDIQCDDTIYRFRPTGNARERLQKLLDLQEKLATAYQATSHMTDTKAQTSRRAELDCIYATAATALAQVFYTQQWPALPQGGELEEAPGLFQHHAYYWIMITKEQLKSCFPQTYVLYYNK